MDTTKANKELREEMKNKGIKFWQVADYCGVTETTIVKWFRHELPKEKANAIKLYLDSVPRS